MNARPDIIKKMNARKVIPILLLASALPLNAAPKPSIIGKDWQLAITYSDPQRMSIRLPGDEHETTFWYVMYTVTNKGRLEVPFFPTFELVTDQLSVITGGEDISPTVYDAIRKRHRKTHPFFRDPNSMYGPVLPGEDNSRTSAIAFRQMDLGVNRFTIYAGGLSGEIQRLQNPGFDRKKPISDENQPFFVLRKTLAIRYDLPGDNMTRQQTTPVRVSQEWVMR